VLIGCIRSGKATQIFSSLPFGDPHGVPVWAGQDRGMGIFNRTGASYVLRLTKSIVLTSTSRA